MVEKVIGSESYDSNGMIVSVGDYTIRKRKKVGFMEVILGTREDCVYGYMVALLVYHSIPISVSVDNPVVVKSYSEAMRLFVMTVNEAHLHLERQKAFELLCDDEIKVELKPFTDRDCCPIGTHEDITGKIVAIQSEPTRFDFTHSAYQLVLVEGGSGATGERGWTFYGVRLASRERGIWRRSDILGVLRHDCMPLWAMYMTHEIRRCGIYGNPSDDTGGAEVHV